MRNEKEQHRRSLSCPVLSVQLVQVPGTIRSSVKELSGSARKRFLRHVTTCADCRSMMRIASELRGELVVFKPRSRE